MRYRCVLVLLILLLSLTCTALGAEEKLKVRNADGSEAIREKTSLKSISLEEAVSQNKDFEDAGILSKDNDEEDETEEEETPGKSYSYETVEDEDYIRNEVAAGNKQFLVDVVTGMLKGLWEVDEDDEEKEREEVDNAYKILTLEPKPYEDKTVVDLYGGYLNFTIFITIMFILGESVSRNIDRMKITSSSKYRLPQRKFIGGVALSLLAILSNIIFKWTLDIIECLNDYIMAPAIPAITPDPENIFMFLMLGLCELLVCIFFIVRYYLIHVFAVICSVIVVLLVPETSRDFAKNVLEKMARILVMQPAALFVMSVSVMNMDTLPIIGYIGLFMTVFLTCYYFMFGNFTLLKTAISIAVSKGLVKTGVRYK